MFIDRVSLDPVKLWKYIYNNTNFIYKRMINTKEFTNILFHASGMESISDPRKEIIYITLENHY